MASYKLKYNKVNYELYRELIQFKNKVLLLSKVVNIGKVVSDARKASGLSQRDLCEIVGSSQSTISHMENKSVYTGIDRFDQICILKEVFSYLEIDIDDLYEKKILEENDEKIILQVIGDLCRMNKEKKKLVCDFIIDLD